MHAVRWFTLAGGQRDDAAVRRWFAERPDALGTLAGRWFDAVRACGDDVLELLHDGHPTACVGELAWAEVQAFRAHVNLGFFFGAVLPDPQRLLLGTGRYMRHVRLGPAAMPEPAALHALIVHAHADARARWAARAERRP